MKKIKIIIPVLLIIAIAAFVLTACPNGGYNETQKHTITFNTHGGTPIPPVQTVAYGHKATRPSVDPQKTDYTFVRWANAEGGASEFNFATHAIRSNITIHAVWELDDNGYDNGGDNGYDNGGDNGYDNGGDNGTGDNGTGDNGAGDNGTGDNGTGDNGTGDNGYGDNGYGNGNDNGYGDNGYDNGGDNGYGNGNDNGYGDNGYGNGNDNGYGDNGYDNGGDNGTGDNGYNNGNDNGNDNGYGNGNDNGYNNGNDNGYDDNGYNNGNDNGYGDNGYGNGNDNGYGDNGYNNGNDNGYGDNGYHSYEYARIAIPNNLPNNTFTLSYIRVGGQQFSVNQWLLARPEVPDNTNFTIAVQDNQLVFSGIGNKQIARDNETSPQYIEFDTELKQVLAHGNYKIDYANASFNNMTGNLYITVTIDGVTHVNVFKPSPINLLVPSQLVGRAFVLDRREGEGVSQHPIPGIFTIEILPGSVVFGSNINGNIQHMTVSSEGGIEINAALKQILAHEDYVITAARSEVVGEELHIYVTVHGIENRNVFVPISDALISVPDDMPRGVFVLDRRYVGEIGQNETNNVGGVFMIELVRVGQEGEYSHVIFTAGLELGGDIIERKAIKLDNNSLYFDAALREILAHGVYNISHAYAQMSADELHIVVYNMGVKNVNVFRKLSAPVIEIVGELPTSGKYSLTQIRSYAGWKYWEDDKSQDIAKGLIVAEFSEEYISFSNNHPVFAPNGDLNYELDLNGGLEWSEDLRRVFGGGHYAHEAGGEQVYFPTSISAGMVGDDLVIAMHLRGTLNVHVFERMYLGGDNGGDNGYDYGYNNGDGNGYDNGGNGYDNGDSGYDYGYNNGGDNGYDYGEYAYAA